MTHVRQRLAAALALAALVSCNKASTSSGGPTGLSDQDLAALPAETQYAVANRLLGALYTGVAPADFFDLSAGFATPTVSAGRTFLARARTALGQPLADRQPVVDHLAQTYDMDTWPPGAEAVIYPMALLWELTRPEAPTGTDATAGHLSKDAFDLWMAYTLATTILFAPATELDSVDNQDAQKVLYRLNRGIAEDQPIDRIVYDHVTSQENWRRFRSPEDNTREMMEIFLGRFVDAEVPLAARACRNWQLTSGDEGYQLLKDYGENTTPVDVLDTTVTTCDEFSRKLTQHPRLVPTIAATLVNKFFAGATADERSRLARAFAGAGPTTFRQLFTAILFSREFLLQSSRTLSLEESYFNLARRLGWTPGRATFNDLASPADWRSKTVFQMRQAPLSYKLGRREIPLDSLSFATYHKVVRENLLVDRRGSTGEWETGWDPRLYTETGSIQGDDFTQFLFVTVLGRRAQGDELSTLGSILAAKGWADETTDKRRLKTILILDYLSRLAEPYAALRVQ
jgi:hypothetical protein